MEDLPESDNRDSSPPSPERGAGTSRRAFTRIGAVSTPIVLSLASRPVLATQCLSEALSGNLSDQRESCLPGLSPGAWKTPGGAGVWPAPFSRGVYHPDATYTKNNGSTEACGIKNNGDPAKPNQWECYVGGTTAGGGTWAVIFQAAGIPLDLTLLEILWVYSGTSMGVPGAHIVSALLNMYSFPSYAISSEADLLGLVNGDIPIPGGLSLNEYLDTTWD